MTVDELQGLCGALLGEVGVRSPADFRSGIEVLRELDDDQFLLAVRFVSGERVLTGPAERPTLAPTPRPGGRPVKDINWDAIDEDEEDWTPPPSKSLRSDVPLEQESRSRDLGDGVTLGFD